MAQRLPLVRTVILVAALSLPQQIQCQINPAFTQSPANSNSGGSGNNNVFYLDSNSDCNGPIRELLSSTATIKGSDPSQTRIGPTTCTIRVRSMGQFDGTILSIEVKSMNIQDCTTQVSLYDGDGAQKLMMPFDCRSSQNQNRKLFITSGNTATFIMTRQNTMNVNFDIEITVTPNRAGIDPGTSGTLGAGYFDKFPQTAIVGMIGAFYVLILVLCGVIVVYFSRSYWGLNKRWETHQLSTVKTGTVFESKSQPSDIWSVQTKPTSQYNRGVTDSRPRKAVAPSEDDTGFYNDNAFQKRQLVNDERDKARPKYTSVNASFAAAEKDHNRFEEKTTTSRGKDRNGRNKLPPPYDDAVSDHSSEHSSDEESDNTSNSTSVKKRSESSEEERSERSGSTESDSSAETDSGSETESDEESESDHESSRDHGARAKRYKKALRTSKAKDTKKAAATSKHTQPPMPSLQHAPQMQQVPYGVYPSAHMVPIMTGPGGQFQPYPVVHAFPPPSAATFPSGPQAQPTQPPIYSYLARRGYAPMDGHSSSQASTADTERSGHRQLKEPELRLDSGVEYMSR